MKIGIYGGCFNPPHKMHESIAKNLIKEGYLDKVVFVPTGDYYPKKNLEKAEKRMEMLKLICQGDNKLEVSDCEIKKHQYTYQTMQHFQEKFPNDDIFFITGSDNFKELDTWKNYQTILEKYNLIVIQRNKDDLEELRNRYKQNVKVIFVVLKNSEITSSMIREEILKDGVQNQLRKYMDKKVIDYIFQNEMYLI